MDGNSTITLSLLALSLGAGLGVLGYMANAKAKARAEGVAEGRLQETMNNVLAKIDKMNESNEAFQKDHREEHRKLDVRMQKLENYVLLQRNKGKIKEVINTDIEE